MELWQLHLIMFFSCFLVFTLAVVAIRRFFLGRRHLKSEFQGPRRKGDGPVLRSASEVAADAAAVDAVAVAEVFRSSNAALQVKPLGTIVPQLEAHDSEQLADIDHEYVSALKLLPSFRDATAQELEQLAQYVRRVAVAAGETIFRSGDAANTVYIIKYGSVSLQSATVDDTEMGSDRQLTTGDFFGEDSLEFAEMYSSTAVATTACQMLILERSKVALSLPAPHALAKRSSPLNVSLKSAATAGLFVSSLSLRDRTPTFELPGVSYSAPSPLPQQQAPLALVPSYSIPQPSSSLSFEPHVEPRSNWQHSDSAPANASAAAPASSAAATGSAARVPKSLLKKHAMLFDSDASAV
jgi:CRP-like cAMP-binding protein